MTSIGDDLKLIMLAIRSAVDMKLDAATQEANRLLFDAVTRLLETALTDLHHCGSAAEQQPTLRDWFAGQAMQGLLAACNSDENGVARSAYEENGVARSAYEMADAMMAAREPREFLQD
jgi:hypothetical protein